MKQLLDSFTHYEKWANTKLLDLILTISEEQQKRDIKSSFSSIQKTCLHVWDASSIWWQRMQHHTEIVVPSLSFHPGMEDIAKGLLHQNQEWINWIESMNEEELDKTLSYKNRKGEAFEEPVKEILLHLNNHGTYHRGQLVTMLREVGVEKIPPTDYILYARS